MPSTPLASVVGVPGWCTSGLICLMSFWGTLAARGQATILNYNASGGGTLDFNQGEKLISGHLAAGRYSITGAFQPGNPTLLTIFTEAKASGTATLSATSGAATVAVTATAEITDLNVVPPANLITATAIGSGGGGCNFQVNTPVRVTARIHGDIEGSINALTLDTSLLRSSAVISLRPPAGLSVNAYTSAGVVFDYGAIFSTDPVFSSAAAGSLEVTIVPRDVPQGRVRAIEVTQIIQDWSNSVPLMEGKRTYARVFVDAVDPNDADKLVTGELHGFRQFSAEFPDSPLTTINQTGGGQLWVDSAAPKARDSLTGPLNFEMPPNWCSGTITLKFQGQNIDQTCGDTPEPGGVGNDCSVTLTFHPAQHLPMKLLRVKTTDPATGSVIEPSPADIQALALHAPDYLPVTDLDYEMGELPVPYQSITNALDLLAELAAQKTLDKSTRLYYGAYAVTAPVFAGAQKIAGVANKVGGTVACGEVLPLDILDWNVAAHEIGHLLGREHSIDRNLGISTFLGSSIPAWKGYCGERTLLTAGQYPYFYTNGTSTFPSIGPMTSGDDALVYWVYPDQTDNLFVRTPYENPDLMGYCSVTLGIHPPSKFTYENVLSFVEARQGIYPVAATDKDPGNGPQPLDFGPGPNYLLLRGLVDLASNTVAWRPFRCLYLSEPPPVPPAGLYTLELLDGSGGVVHTLSFDLTMNEDGPDARQAFNFPMPLDAAVRQARLLLNGTSLSVLVGSTNIPVVQVATPNGGEVISTATATFTWSASDADGNPLTYHVSYSPDGGDTWSTLALDLETNAITVARSSLKASTNALLKVSASDGFWCTEDISDAVFTVANNPPEITILSPVSNRHYFGRQSIILRAAVYDPEQGSGGVTNIVWRTDRDRILGYGPALAIRADQLPIGTNQISATAMDSGGLTQAATNIILVSQVAIPRLRTLGPPANGLLPLEITGGPQAIMTLDASADMTTWATVTNFILSDFSDNLAVPASAAQSFYRASSRAIPPGAPTLLTQPTNNVSTTNGAAFELTCIAGGADGVNYQWYFNGDPLSFGTNASLVFYPAHAFQSGTYYQVASNAQGAVTSAVTTVTITGADFEAIHWFGTNSQDGLNGWGPLALDSAGYVYGCARNGGISNAGVVFRVRNNGLGFSALHRFQSATDGAVPLGGIMLASDGALYGTCSAGGTNNSGTIFKLNRDGTGFVVLHHFLSSGDCRNPQAELLEASDGKLYGTAYTGGGFGPGGIFRLDKNGAGYSTIYGFKTTGNDGQSPLGGLLEAVDGMLYGTTELGGLSNKGTIFRLSKAGTNYSRLKDLGLVAGGASSPQCTLIQAGDGLLYGTTYAGGTASLGTVFSLTTNGTISVLRNFGSANNGNEPRAGLVQAANGDLLGTTRIGGTNNLGLIFQVGTNSPYNSQNLRHFGNTVSDGARPRSPLLRGNGGIYYGTTFGGGFNDQGTVFRILVP